MIKMDCYSPEFEKAYWEVVDKKVCTTAQQQILSSCVKFLPGDFFERGNPEFKEIVLAPYQKLKRAKKYIENNLKNGIKDMENECFDFSSTCKNPSNINDLYLKMYDAFGDVMKAQQNKTSMRVRIVKEADITVCPYCNREYINCRADSVSGAQLDHFLSRSAYPIFAVSLYNLVPVCGNCNRIKNAKTKEFASPFDEDIDWDNDIKFTFPLEESDDFKIEIEVTSKKEKEAKAIKNNITEMRISEAYQIHSLEIKELQDKKQAYSESQKKEIRKIMQKIDISDDKIKKIVFGPKITLKDMRKKPLGKMVSDWHKKWGIY